MVAEPCVTTTHPCHLALKGPASEGAGVVLRGSLRPHRPSRTSHWHFVSLCEIPPSLRQWGDRLEQHLPLARATGFLPPSTQGSPCAGPRERPARGVQSLVLSTCASVLVTHLLNTCHLLTAAEAEDAVPPISFHEPPQARPGAASDVRKPPGSVSPAEQTGAAILCWLTSFRLASERGLAGGQVRGSLEPCQVHVN